MAKEGLYSIGKVSKICDVSPRTLRYYEEVGLLQPDRINERSGYRYYSAESMYQVQVIRYLCRENRFYPPHHRLLSPPGGEPEGVVRAVCRRRMGAAARGTFPGGPLHSPGTLPLLPLPLRRHGEVGRLH